MAKKSKKYVPDNININGSSYEKMSPNSVEVELELSEDVLNKIDLLVHSGKFVSRGDAIRSLLRTYLEMRNKK